MPRIHDYPGPLSGRLRRILDRVLDDRRAEEIGRRIAYASDPARAEEWPVRTCPKCDMNLLPGELVICRPCADGRINRNDPE